MQRKAQWTIGSCTSARAAHVRVALHCAHPAAELHGDGLAAEGDADDGRAHVALRAARVAGVARVARRRTRARRQG
eukprot:635424-Pleurochrysis_carterae.AAC.1